MNSSLILYTSGFNTSLSGMVKIEVISSLIEIASSSVILTLAAINDRMNLVRTAKCLNECNC